MGYATTMALYDAYLTTLGAGLGVGHLDGHLGHLDGPLWVAVAAGFTALVVKEGLFRATKSAGEKAGSKVGRTVGFSVISCSDKNTSTETMKRMK